MSRDQRRDKTKGWYTISVDTLRGWGIFLLLIALAAAGFFGYRQLERYTLRRQAEVVIEEARALAQRVQEEKGAASFQEEFLAAYTSLGDARTLFAQAAYAPARDAGRRSRALLEAILDAVRQRAPIGEAQFIAVQGGVEYRRGERGEWEEARGRVILQSGDYVKTSGNGSAEIVFMDGTLYTVRPGTLFLVTRTRATPGSPGEQAIAMEYGWVNLNTAQRESLVTTPRAEARVGRETEAVVAFDRAKQVGQFAAYRGELEVAAKGGLKRSVGTLQQVIQTGDLLSEPKPLPAAVEPLEPPDQAEVSLDGERELGLSWQPVAGAARYALQVSRNRLFVDNVIDVDSRAKPSARLGLRGEGTFEWRVAAVSRQGLQGPWSAPRSFRVFSARRSASEGDTTAPPLEIEEVQSYGSIFMVAGRTEPGSAVEVNREPVVVEADGSFTKTVQLTQEGWSIVEIRSRDVSGNETVRRRRVFVETL